MQQRSSQHRNSKTQHRLRRAAITASAGLSVLLLGSGHAEATAYTWSSGNSGSFSTGFDGSPTIANDPANQFTFNAGNYTATNDLGSLQVNSLTINNTDPTTNTITVASGPLVFNGSAPQITVTGGNATFTSQLTSGNGMNITNSGAGNLLLNSQIFSATGATTITNAGSGEVVMADCSVVAYFGTNVVINLANTGTGQFLMGDLGATPAVLNTGLGGIVNITQGYVTASNTGGVLS